VEREEWPYDPRTILRRQVEKAEAKGYEFMIGMELE
jgi:glutamine synthetase